jgi:hypothetical protein
MTEAAANVPRLVCEAAIRTLTFHSPGWAWLQDAIVRIIAFAGGRHADGLGIINQCWRDGLLILERLADGTTTVLSPMDCGPIRAAPNPEEVVWVEPYMEGRFLVWTPAAHAAQSPQPESVPPPAPKKRSRRRTTHEGTQTRRARAVLDRIFPKDKYPDGYPDEDEMAWQDVWNMFCKEYSCYAKENPSRYGRPSQSTVKRVMGRAE